MVLEYIDLGVELFIGLRVFSWKIWWGLLGFFFIVVGIEENVGRNGSVIKWVNGMVGVGNGKRFLKLSLVIGINNSVVNSSRRGFREEIDIGWSWKFVMFGEY